MRIDDFRRRSVGVLLTLCLVFTALWPVWLSLKAHRLLIGRSKALCRGKSGRQSGV
jgi:hypothetical protein